ncbi:hypothetical protein G6F57_002325 [Rhizopus arrhizus]|uniref:Uncharacterized protein n=1 Tax=Rhizopus oryzae TaxID=64495 RepID=A0A9P6X528_RHIOR|nr:hypothetical protein G6F23_001727 [Rhizopus arrhizus]KAG1428370.1 hypothetical protein G6F58_000602 [Rhizopus delemar]KAG0764399.1 hypothetical protein G6F24_005246 [Rhizopus arrhizus]KAG0792462.1 hypothetical protein G6F22_005855 [Rhizopus arrhizus]KAG0792532.1 hypothetical protein G6F21_004290 [Rhizopus arrhizus]
MSTVLVVGTRFLYKEWNEEFTVVKSAVKKGAVQVLGAELKRASESGQRFLPDESCTLAIHRPMGRYLFTGAQHNRHGGSKWEIRFLTVSLALKKPETKQSSFRHPLHRPDWVHLAKGKIK